MAIVWWHWLALGLVLIALELAASGGFYIIFFGFAAMVISGLCLVGIAGPPWLQLLLFSVVSVLSLLFFRSPLLRWMKMDKGGADVDSLVGETAIVKQDIPAGEIGRVELRGTSWTARNHGTEPLTNGRRCVVVAVDRLMLIIEPEGVRS